MQPFNRWHLLHTETTEPKQCVYLQNCCIFHSFWALFDFIILLSSSYGRLRFPRAGGGSGGDREAARHRAAWGNPDQHYHRRSRPDLWPCTKPRPLPHVDTSVEEGEIVTEADMPPLTGECLWGLFQLYCCLKLSIHSLSLLISRGIQQQLPGCSDFASSRRDLWRGLGSFWPVSQITTHLI